MTDCYPVDELAARRRAKSAAAVNAAAPSSIEAALQEADYTLLDLIEFGDGELLVDAERVRDLARAADRLIVRCLLAERDRSEVR